MTKKQSRKEEDFTFLSAILDMVADRFNCSECSLEYVYKQKGEKQNTFANHRKEYTK